APRCPPPTPSWTSCASTSTFRTTPPAPSRASRPEAVEQPPGTPDLLLVGGDVLLHDGAWRVERADVTVRGGRIDAVGRADGRADRESTSVSVRDCNGCLIIPGLIQAHVHLCQTLFRGLADDLRLEDWLVRRIWPLEEAESLAKRWHNGGNAGGRLRVCFAPRFVPSCSGPLLRAASELAERFDAQLHTHAAETIVERETVLRTTGLEEIAYLDSVG